QPPRITLFPYTTLFRSPDLRRQTMFVKMKYAAAIAALAVLLACPIGSANAQSRVAAATGFGDDMGQMEQFAPMLEMMKAKMGKRSEEHTSELQSPCNLV